MRRSRWMGLWLVGVALALCSATAGAWSNKEHIQLTRIAVERLVADPATVMRMKAQQTAWAVARVRKLLLNAWNEARE